MNPADEEAAKLDQPKVSRPVASLVHMQAWFT